jgi:hypothetical protein
VPQPSSAHPVRDHITVGVLTAIILVPSIGVPGWVAAVAFAEVAYGAEAALKLVPAPVARLLKSDAAASFRARSQALLGPPAN